MEGMKRIIVVCALSFVLIGLAPLVSPLAGQSKPNKAALERQPSNCPVAPPTAAEVFHLRTECAELGEKLLLKLYDSPYADQESHYDPLTNRCYVEIHHWEGVLREGVVTNPKLARMYLYDGQTQSLLAYYKLDGTECPTGTDCKRTGRVFVDSARSDDADVALNFITNAMADDRKR